MTLPAAYTALIEHTRHTHLLGSTASLLSWDQETMMPPGGLELRTGQLTQLAGMAHRMSTDPKIGDWLAACEADATLTADPLSPQAVNVRRLRRDYDRATKLPADLVETMAQTSSRAKAEWIEARRADDFARFEPWLQKQIELNRRAAECYGWADGGEPWDALAESYEPGCTAKAVAAVFDPLRDRLSDLVRRIGERIAAGRGPSEDFIRLKLPVEKQEAFVRFVAQAIGFDFSRGRLDRSAHPFCSGTHPGDVRMTTRFADDNLPDALGSTMHESGHGLYEQGLPAEHTGTPMGEAAGLAIHESQSRLWENQVGRSRAFWRWATPKLADFFGDAVAGLDAETAYATVNRVKPDLIRVEADEATYNLHVMVRFELERAMMRGDLKAADVPAAWNARYKEYLGIDVPCDAKGCLQDIHWPMGALGYFPTYTLGNLCCAQFFEAAARALGDLDAMFARGEFAPLKAWLTENIHRHARRYEAAELVEHVTGEPLSAEPLLRHLEGKLAPLYGL